MASGGFILFIGDGDNALWRLAPLSNDAPAVAVDALPGSMATALRQLGYRGEGILLALPSSWCMAATIDVARIGAHDHKAMTYCLEEHLPLAAESVVADFLVRNGQALAVCARLEAVRGAIVALESDGVFVHSVAPAALLAAQDVARGDGADHVLSLAEGSRVSLISVHDGVANSWATVAAADAGGTTLQLDVISLEFDDEPPVRSFSADDVERATRRQARRVLGGREAAWGEMRRGALAPSDRLHVHRKVLNAALAAAAVLLLACSGALLWRAHLYERKARANEAALASAFQEAFPGWAVPTNVRSLIESEHRKAAAQFEHGATNGRLERSALRTLHEVLGHLQAHERWDIQRMMFDDHSFELEGNVRATEGLDRFAAAVRRDGMKVAPPESHKGAGGVWNFRIRGDQPSATASAQARRD